jgi:MoaA/NifB/PqqE/SkfB family radical SAM enzyme
MKKFGETILRYLGAIAGLQQQSFDWIQVEVTTRCNAACVYCPYRVFRGEWKPLNMTMDTFRKLLPALPSARFVHLQGWGEPLLNPDLFEMIREAKAAGCRVGTTSNANLWTDEISERIVELGVDLVAFSLAGPDEKQDLIRCGTHLTNVLNAIRSINRAKQEHGSTTPSIHIAYMVLRSGLDEVKRLPDLLDGLDVDEVVLSTLDFLPSEELAGETLIPKDHAEYEHIRSVLSDAVELGEKRGLAMHFRLQAPGEKHPTCTENVLKSFVVSVTGEVCACVYTNLPVLEQTGLKGALNAVRKQLCFGNVNEQSVAEIWQSPAYKEFRRSHERGEASLLCAECPKLFLE